MFPINFYLNTVFRTNILLSFWNFLNTFIRWEKNLLNSNERCFVYYCN